MLNRIQVRRWIITRLEKGYGIGTPCRRLGGGSDKGIIPEALEHFERMMGGLPERVVYVGAGMGRRITRC